MPKGITFQGMKYALVLCLLVLTACTTAEERAAQDHQKCIDLGFAPQTEAYGNCRLQLMSVRQQRRAAGAAFMGAAAQQQRNIMMSNPYR